MVALRLALLLCAVLLSAPASAKGAYWIDSAIADCKARTKDYAVVAASSAGTYFCVFGKPENGNFRAQAFDLALKQCNRLATSAIRSKAPCVIVWDNGRILDRAFYQAMARDLAVPVSIQSTDGVNKKALAYKGEVVIGKTILEKNDVRIMVDGRQICRGWITGIGFGRTGSFVVSCLDGLKLSGSATLKGLQKIDGYYRAAAFTAVIRNPPHEMRLSTD